MRRLIVALAVLPLLCGFGGDDFSRSFYVRLDGFFGASAESVKAWRVLEIQVAGDSQLRRFSLTQIVVPFGETLGSNVLDAVQPFTPNFVLAGGEADLAKIKAATPAELLRITGTTSIGNQWILISRVEIIPPDEVDKVLEGTIGGTPGAGPALTQRVRGVFSGCAAQPPAEKAS